MMLKINNSDLRLLLRSLLHYEKKADLFEIKDVELEMRQVVELKKQIIYLLKSAMKRNNY